MSIAAFAGGNASEHSEDSRGGRRARTARPGKRYGLDVKRQDNIAGVLFGGAEDGPEDRFARPSNPNSTSHWQVGGGRQRQQQQQQPSQRQPATDIYGGRIDEDDEDQFPGESYGQSRRQNVPQNGGWVGDATSTRHQPDVWHREAKQAPRGFDTKVGHESKFEGKHAHYDEQEEDEMEQFRRWKQQQQQQQQRHQPQQQPHQPLFTQHNQHSQSRHHEPVPSLDLHPNHHHPRGAFAGRQENLHQQPMTNVGHQQQVQHPGPGRDVDLDPYSDNKPELAQRPDPAVPGQAAARRKAHSIPLHAKIENVRYFLERESQKLIKNLSSAERLSIRGPDLRKVMRRRALYAVFEQAKARKGAGSRDNRRHDAARGRPASRSGMSQINFGGSNRGIAQGSPSRALRGRGAANDTAGRRQQGRKAEGQASTAIMEQAFINAVQKMTLYDSPPLTDEEAARLWHSCHGDYSNFLKVVFPGGRGGTKGNSKSAKHGRVNSRSGSSSRTSNYQERVDPAVLELRAAAKVDKARPEIMKGPWNRNGKGVRTVKAPKPDQVPRRMQYRFSRTTVQPPSDFKRSDVSRSAQMPKTHLNLQHVYGFRGQDYASHGNALYISPLGEAVYFAAGVGVVMDVAAREQRFLQGHTDDITVMSVNKRRDLVVTGQMGVRSCLYIWSLNSCKLLKKVGFQRTTKAHGVQKRQPYYERWVCAACFTHDSHYVIGVGCNDSHMLAVWHIGHQVRESTLVAEYAAQNGAPAKVYGAVASDKTSIGLVSPGGQEHYFLTFGDMHLKFWTLRPNETRSHEKISMTSAAYKSYPKPRETLCAGFLPSGHALTGGSNGMVYMWWNAECVHAFQAHDHGPCSAITIVRESDDLDFDIPRPGVVPAGAAQDARDEVTVPKVPQLFDLARITQAVTFFTGGAGGMVIAWRGTEGDRPQTGRQTNRNFQAVAKTSLLEAGGSIQAVSYADNSAGGALGARAASHAPRSQSFAPRENHLQRRSGTAKPVKTQGTKKNLTGPRSAGPTPTSSRPFIIQSLDFHSGYVFAATTEDTLWTIGCTPAGGFEARFGPQGASSSFSARMPSARGGGDSRAMTRGRIGSPRSSGVPGVDRPSSSLGRALNLSGRLISVTHFGGVYGLAPHPRRNNVFASLAADRQLLLWDASQRRPLFRAVLPGGQMVASAATIHPVDDHIAVGFDNGAVIVYDMSEAMRQTQPADRGQHQLAAQGTALTCSADLLPEISRWQHSKEGISVLKYSPDGTKLAAGTRDSVIDVYRVSKQVTQPAGRGRGPMATTQYTFAHRMSGHSASVICMDWSSNSALLQSNCSNYEIIYWDVEKGSPIASLNDAIERDTNWHTWTCVLGFPVMGIWPDYSDGTDVNAVSRSRDRRYVVTADDHGKIKLFNAPCVVEDAPSLSYPGHSSHVTGVTFIKDDSHVISTGGLDEAVFQWEYVPQVYNDANKAAQAREFTIKNFASTRPW